MANEKVEKVRKIGGWVNLTPHDIVVYTGGRKVVIPPSGQVARVATHSRLVGVAQVEGKAVEVYTASYENVQGLPLVCLNCTLRSQCEAEGRQPEKREDGGSCSLQEPYEGYLVSSLVLTALRERGVVRYDVFAPDTSPAGAVRDKDNKIIGVRNFLTL